MVEQEFENVWDKVTQDLLLIQGRSFEERGHHGGSRQGRLRKNRRAAKSASARRAVRDRREEPDPGDGRGGAKRPRRSHPPVPRAGEAGLTSSTRRIQKALAKKRTPIFEEKVVVNLLGLADITDPQQSRARKATERRGRRAGTA